MIYYFQQDASLHTTGWNKVYKNWLIKEDLS